MQPCTCNRTRSGGDAEGWPTTSLIPAHKAMSTCATDPPPPPAAPRTHSQQPHDHMHWPGQPASRVSQAWPRRAGVPAPPPPAHTQCHRPHNVTRKRRPAGPAPTPILAAPLGESRAGGAGASGRAQAQARAGGLCSARASVGARVRPSVRWSHRTEAAAAAASASSYARVHGRGAALANQGRRRADGRPAAPPPVLQLSSPWAPQSGGAAAKEERCGGWGDSRRPPQ